MRRGLRAIGQAVAWTWDKITMALGLAVMVFLLFSVVNCYGIPSLFHQPTAHRLYDYRITIESRFAVHPLDRLIHRAAVCQLQYDGFMPAEGVDIAFAARFATTYDPNSVTTRRAGFAKLVSEGTRLAMTPEQMHHALGTRAAYRAGYVDLDRLKDLLAQRCD